MSEETTLLILGCLIERQTYWEKVLANANLEMNQTKSAAAKAEIKKITTALTEIDNL